ncbi:hypothetical protein QL285_046386 [Trifolium repens]|nr:hypothetical protein QL285_046386 [Trifolium repens]
MGSTNLQDYAHNPQGSRRDEHQVIMLAPEHNDLRGSYFGQDLKAQIAEEISSWAINFIRFFFIRTSVFCSHSEHRSKIEEDCVGAKSKEEYFVGAKSELDLLRSKKISSLKGWLGCSTSRRCKFIF